LGALGVAGTAGLAAVAGRPGAGTSCCAAAADDSATTPAIATIAARIPIEGARIEVTDSWQNPVPAYPKPTRKEIA